MNLHYTMVIEWSDEDQCYLVRLPEWGPYAGSHGATYEAAAKAGREVLEMLVQHSREDGKPLPMPRRAVERRKALDEMTALAEELGVYD